jgi:hypothetical protein
MLRWFFAPRMVFRSYGTIAPSTSYPVLPPWAKLGRSCGAKLCEEGTADFPDNRRRRTEGMRG